MSGRRGMMPGLGILALWFAGVLHAQQTGLPDPVVPRGFGVNIHFTDAQPGEMERFAEAGYRLARMDLGWGGVERERGVYDFTAFDRLVASLKAAGARPLFILDYGNRLYDDGLAPHTDEGRAAFARYAQAAAAHFAGQGVLWEIWNEPNLDGFWKPAASAEDYARLAILTAQAVREGDANAVILAPGSSGFPWAFLETVFRAGLLDRINAVSVHPYRSQPPETAAEDYQRLRALIARFAPPAKRQMPIISSEWGYTTAEAEQCVSEAVQARYLARQWLANMASGVNLSIFYDWKDDGPNPREREHRFGTVRQDLTPKPSFEAARALIHALDGFTYRHRLAAQDVYDWRLLFQKGDSDELAVVEWSTRTDVPEEAQTPSVRIVGADQDEHDALALLPDLHPTGPVPLSRDVPAEWLMTSRNRSREAAEVEVTYRVQGSSAQSRSFTLPVPPGQNAYAILRVNAEDGQAESGLLEVSIRWNSQPLPALHPLAFVRVDPLRLSLVPVDGRLAAVIENPAGIVLKGAIEQQGQRIAPVSLSRAQQILELPVRVTPGSSVELVDENGARLASATAPRFEPIVPFHVGYRSVLHVDNKGEPAADLTPVPGISHRDPSGSALLKYRFEPGWRYLTLEPKEPLVVPRDATALTYWILGDGSGNRLRCRLRDATGQVFQLDLGSLDSKGFDAVRIPLQGWKEVDHWGGANDGVVHSPLVVEAIVLIDSAHNDRLQEERVQLSSPAFVFESSAAAVAAP